MLENIIGDIQGYIEKVRRQNSFKERAGWLDHTFRFEKHVSLTFSYKVTNNNTEQTLLVDREDPGHYFELIWSDSSQSIREFSEKDIFC